MFDICLSSGGRARVRPSGAEAPPRGDRLLQLRRRVPVGTIIVDTPERIAGLVETVDELADEVGLVRSEMVPAGASVSEGQRLRGGLRLARLASKSPGRPAQARATIRVRYRPALTGGRTR